MSNYKIPAATQIGHVHLKVSDIDQALSFYQDLLGFELITRINNQAAFISAGGYHHHIGLNTWFSKNGPRSSMNGVGLFHLAILYPERRDLAAILQRLINHDYPLTGVSDHGVSEAIYLDDPDGNGVELYWDRARADWPIGADGRLKMYTKKLDVDHLLAELMA